MFRVIMQPTDLRQLADRLIAAEGFDRWGYTPAAPTARQTYLTRWLAEGRAGSMDYLHRHTEMRTNAAELMPGAQTVIVCALNYNQPSPAPATSSTPPSSPTNPTTAPTGRIARYAWGDDYHRVIKKKLIRIMDALRRHLPDPFEARACVDTAPLLEREYAMAAGVGWIGKNTLVMHENLGSYFFLGEIVTTLSIPGDGPSPDHCGSCTRCLNACPTEAFPAPYEMDASRCISYLTIEHRTDDIPRNLAAKMDNWIFGCDICQEVCPHNRRAPETTEPRFKARPERIAPPLPETAKSTDEAYRTFVQGSAIKRAKPEMMRRNARIALRNAGMNSEPPE